MIEPYPPHYNYINVPMMPQQQYVIPGYGSQPMSYSGLPQMYMQGYPNFFMPEV